MVVASSERLGRSGFTILELLIATAILSIILIISLSVMEHTSRIWRRSMGTIEAFQGARTAFDLITRDMGQATLNTYLDYDNPSNPRRYLRKSELQFVIGKSGDAEFPGSSGSGTAVFFQAPLSYTTDATNYGGLDGALNSCGFYVTFGTDPSLPPHVINSPGYVPKYRYRLMNLLVPVEANRIFDNTNYSATRFSWFSNATNSAFPVAENIIAFFVHPEDPDDASLFPSIGYNSQSNWNSNPQPITANQLPPLMRVIIVAIDENSARRLDNGSTPPAALNAAVTQFQSKMETDPRDPSGALNVLGTALSSAGINYRVFSTKVPMRESKWSKN